MKLTKLFLVGLVALTAIAVSTPNVAAKNIAKYTNLPSVVASNCPNINTQSSVHWTGNNSTAKLQVNTTNHALVGFEVYCSLPSSQSTPSATSGPIPPGTYTFNITGDVSSLVFVDAFSVSSTDAHHTTGVTINNGVGTVTIPTPSSGSLVAVQIAFLTESSSNVTVYLSNFKVNGMTIPLDTSQTDMSTPPGGHFSCFYPCTGGLP